MRVKRKLIYELWAPEANRPRRIRTRRKAMNKFLASPGGTTLACKQYHYRQGLKFFWYEWWRERAHTVALPPESPQTPQD